MTRHTNWQRLAALIGLAAMWAAGCAEQRGAAMARADTGCVREPLTEVGEFTIEPVQPLDGLQLSQLRGLVVEDPAARQRAAEAAARAEPLLGCEPRPLTAIAYEGLLHTDPRRLATVEQLRDMGDVSLVVRHWQASGDEQAAAMLRRYTLAWTSAYEITGNDVNENKFTPMLVAYAALRDSFSAPSRARVDAWVHELGSRHLNKINENESFTNRDMKSVRLVSLAGRILDRSEWQAQAERVVKRFVTSSLHADGTSADLEERDTLTYHMSALRPAVELAMLDGVSAGSPGRSLYIWEGPSGGSLEKSVRYVVPYASGERTRHEWLRSRVALDKARAEAGIAAYEPGKLFEPESALELMELASAFEPELAQIVSELAAGEPNERFTTWQLVVNEAVQRARASDD